MTMTDEQIAYARAQVDSTNWPKPKHQHTNQDHLVPVRMTKDEYNRRSVNDSPTVLDLAYLDPHMKLLRELREIVNRKSRL
jgi:hypothetical protein